VKPLLAQILATAQVRAVENNRYLVQSANKGWSYIIDPAGQIKEKNFSLGATVVYGNISFLSKKSFYTRYGDWILTLVAVLVLARILCLGCKKLTKATNFGTL
jgi:apolipoprotein N-acyltransferase